jgi:hypothetical protein
VALHIWEAPPRSLDFQKYDGAGAPDSTLTDESWVVGSARADDGGDLRSPDGTSPAPLVLDTGRDVRLVNTVLRYESSARPWRRLLEIAADHFPDTSADLALLHSRGVRLELHVTDDRAAYFVTLVGPDVPVVEADRSDRGRIPLSQPLAALATDTQADEQADGRRLAREVAMGALTFRDARSMCEGFGLESFDVELARYRADIERAKALSKKRPK